ncbi:acetyl-CoA synthetase-like protein [Clavulina sp. PMI_390]|nr:acetyl-CoA synthetase-like protein [Clavulina sp. PMI_390]
MVGDGPLVTQPLDGVETIHDILLYAARTFPNKEAMGWREVDKIIEEEKEVTKTVGGQEVKEKKTWKYFQMSAYRYFTFSEFKERVEVVARAMNASGIKKGDVFNVYAATSVNWRLLAHAAAANGALIATAYETLGEDGLAHSLGEPECKGVFTNAPLLPTLLRVLPRTPSIKLVVYDDKPKAGIVDDLKKARPDLAIYSLDEFLEIGKENSSIDLAPLHPSKEDLACIMYTSGTTGAPKGVMLTHGNLIASVGAIVVHIGRHLGEHDWFLAFLPLAHILEYVVELTLFFVGVTTGYGSPKTLSDTSVRNCKGDMAEFRPTLLVGVPAVWETLRKGIMSKVDHGSALAKAVFHYAYAAKKYNIPVFKQLADAIVFSKIKQATGGRLRLALSGGAALSQETQEFMTMAVVKVLQGYGLTETCGMCAVLTPEQFQWGAAGVPVPSMQVKLIDVKEAGYISTGNPPRGEILLQGPSVTQGYFKRDDLNNDESIFTKDGWFRTGDVGQWNEDGTLSIIDRIKNLVKLQGGEYIALERLESVYKSCNLVSNICVHVVPDAKQPMALIFPHEGNLRHFLSTTPPAGFTKDAKGTDFHALCEDKVVAAAVLKECNAVGKKESFKTMELLEAVVLTPDEWTPESGLVTAAQKIQRKAITTKYKAEIEVSRSTSCNLYLPIDHIIPPCCSSSLGRLQGVKDPLSCAHSRPLCIAFLKSFSIFLIPSFSMFYCFVTRFLLPSPFRSSRLPYGL